MGVTLWVRNPVTNRRARLRITAIGITLHLETVDSMTGKEVPETETPMGEYDAAQLTIALAAFKELSKAVLGKLQPKPRRAIVYSGPHYGQLHTITGKTETLTHVAFRGDNFSVPNCDVEELTEEKPAPDGYYDQSGAWNVTGP